MANKRTAFVAAMRFLRKNGRNMVVTEKLIAISVAKSELDRDGLAEILRTHMVPKDPDTN